MIEEDLKADIANIVDLINIKNFPELISDYLHANGRTKYSNLRKFYSSLLDYFGEDIKASYLNRILKYLSSDKESDIYLIDDINEGIYDKELKEFTKDLVKEINKNEDYSNIYESINRKINFMFFDSDEEYCEIKEYHNKKEYEKFIFSLLKHAFSRYKKTLPAIMGSSLFTQSQTMNYKSSGRIRFLNASSLLGNDDATINLYCTLFPSDYNIATKILTRSKDNEKVLWSIAFNLENNYLNKEIIQLIRDRYKYVFNETDDFISKISVTEKGKKKFYDVTMLLGYQMHYYCYKKYNFTKSGNSLGKLLIFDIVSYDNDRQKSIELGKQFLNKEIKYGNINAITNMAVHLYWNPDDPDYDYKKIKKWFETSASFGDLEGNYYYGKMLFEEAQYEKAYKHLIYAAERNERYALALLGEYHRLKDEYDEAIKYYKKAIVCKNYDAAYQLATLYLEMKSDDEEEQALYKNMANDYLEKYYELLSDPIKEKANKLIGKKF